MSAHDTFNVANRALAGHTAGTGQVWAAHPSNGKTISIVSRDLPITTSGANAVYILPDTPASADYTVSARMTIGAVGNVAAGVMLRTDPAASTYYFAEHTQFASNKWRIYKNVAGTITLIGFAASSLTDGATGVMSFEASGTSLTLKWNGATVVSATDSDISAAGRPGIIGTLANSANPPVTYHDFRVETADDDGVFFPDDAAISAGRSGNIWQPLESGRTYASVNTGAWQRLAFTGTSIKLILGTRSFSTLADDLIFDVSIDGGTPIRVTFDPDDPVYSATGLADTSHTLYYRVAGFLFSANQWDAPNQRIELAAVQVDAGDTVSTPSLRPNRVLLFGDSIAYGAISDGASANVTDYAAAWPGTFATLASADIDTAAYSGMGYTNGGPQSMPDFEDTWDFIVSGVARPFAAADAPDYVLVNHGHNDANVAALATAVENTLAAIRVALPSTPIYVIQPVTGAKSQITAGYNAWGDANSRLIDLDDYDATLSSDVVANSHDSTHPIEADHDRIAAALASAILPASGSAVQLSYGKLSGIIGQPLRGRL